MTFSSRPRDDAVIDIRFALSLGALFLAAPAAIGAVSAVDGAEAATRDEATQVVAAGAGPSLAPSPQQHPAPQRQRTPGPSATPVSPASPAAATTPGAATYTEVETVRPSIRIDGLDRRRVLDEIRDVDGVRHATSVRIGRVEVGRGEDSSPRMTIAAVNPRELRTLTPQPTADEIALWQRLDEGALAVTHERARQLGLVLGDDVHLGGRYAVPVRVGAFASNGTPPVADAIVNRATGSRLGLDAVAPTVLVAVDDGASPDAVADALGAVTDAEVTVIPDPRQAQAVSTAQRAAADTVWDVLALCESSGDWHINSGNGFYGGLQFLPESWWMVGGTGMPHEASREEQIHRAEILLSIQGWEAWPVCSVKLGLRDAPPDGQPPGSGGSP